MSRAYRARCTARMGVHRPLKKIDTSQDQRSNVPQPDSQPIYIHIYVGEGKRENWGCIGKLLRAVAITGQCNQCKSNVDSYKRILCERTNKKKRKRCDKNTRAKLDGEFEFVDDEHFHERWISRFPKIFIFDRVSFERRFEAKINKGLIETK